jgi:hypothetical protein
LVNPYKDVFLAEDHFIRTFEESTEHDELIWHRDKNDREIRVIKGEGWQLQMDNELPKEMLVNETYYIKAETYHRVIKGKNDLVLEIREKRGSQ